MMTIVCSFLFPIGLQGARFAASWHGAAFVVLGNAYATLVKLILIDIGVAEEHHHAVRRAERLAKQREAQLPLALHQLPRPAAIAAAAAAIVAIVFAVGGAEQGDDAAEQPVQRVRKGGDRLRSRAVHRARRGAERSEVAAQLSQRHEPDRAVRRAQLSAPQGC